MNNVAGMCAATALTFAAFNACAVDVDKVNQGDTVSTSLQVGSRNIPLPAGSWEVVFKSERTTGYRTINMVTLNLAQVSEKKLTKLLLLDASKQSGDALGDWLNEPCKIKGDAYKLVDRKNSMRDQNCTRVGFLSGIVDTASGDVFVAWANKLKDAGVSYSSEMPFVGVTRYKPGDFLNYVVAFNPQVQGIPPSTDLRRQNSDWHPTRVENIADKKAYYERLLEWSPKLADAMQRALFLEQVTSQDIGEPNWPSSKGESGSK